MTVYFIQAFIYLCAAVVAVPLAKRFGLGSVLGYLIAGVVIGPVVGLVGTETTTLQHFAEFGVVMMLFLVGLELEPEMLWSMRRRLFGLGGLQVTLTALACMLIAMTFGLDWRMALAIGLILSLSSTAIVLQTLNEKGLSRTEGGRGAFSVLLFQDIAVIPMLALIPLLVPTDLTLATEVVSTGADAGHASINLAEQLPRWAYTLVVLSAIGLVVFGGHYLSRPLFRFVAASGLREVFTATALMLVIGIAALMSLVGLSPALGTFLAGVVLANSEFRHELESNIEPFKGLLLGLFFITVGAGINFGVLADNWFLVCAITIGIISLKALIIFGLAGFFGIRYSHRWLVSLSLAQAGEFGFVLLSFSYQNAVINTEITELLALVIAISMFLTPALFIFFDKVLIPRYKQNSDNREDDEIHDKCRVIIAGIGRFGQIVNRLLEANNIQTTVIDHDIKQVENLRSLGIKAYFGDATRPELLETAGIEGADIFVITVAERDRTIELVKIMKQRYPKTKLLVRAFDQIHYYQLKLAGADTVVKETYLSALDIGRYALMDLGFSQSRADKLRAAFINTENQNDDAMFQMWKESQGTTITPSFRELFMRQEEALREVMKEDHDADDEEISRPEILK